MLLTVDIGNTHIVIGAFDGEKLLFEYRLESNAGRTVDEYCALFYALLLRTLGTTPKFRGGIISSVVPPLTTDIVAVVKELYGIDSLVIGPGIKTTLPLRVQDPSSVGADRVVNSLALRELYGCPALVVDFGTATTFDYVNAKGEYEGGVISPGLSVSLESLVKRTAKLPRIELSWPETVIGKNTVSAMQSGTLIGYTCMVDGLIEKIQEEIGVVKHIVATGGLSGTITQHSKYITAHDPTLTLVGMKIIAKLNGI